MYVVVVVVFTLLFPVKYDDVEFVHVVQFVVLFDDVKVGTGEIGLANLPIFVG